MYVKIMLRLAILLLGAQLWATTAVPPDQIACRDASLSLDPDPPALVAVDRDPLLPGVSYTYGGEPANPTAFPSVEAFVQVYARDAHHELEKVYKALERRTSELKYLGAGGQGEVYEAVSKSSGRTYVAKIADNPGDLLRENYWSSLLHELHAQHAPHSANPFLQTRYFPDYQILEMEKAKWDLAKATHGRHDLNRSLNLIAKMGEAVSFMHSQGIVHRDIKASNFLEMPDGRVVLADFALAGRHGSPASDLFLGTPGYMLPEQVRGDSPTFAMDAHAFRMAAIEVATGVDIYLPSNLALHIVKQRKYAKTDIEYPYYPRSPYSWDSSFPKSVSAALWHPDTLPERIAARIEKAKAYATPQKERAYFEEVFSEDFEAAIVKDPLRSAAEFLTSKELMEVAQKGWLKLSPQAKQLLWRNCQTYYSCKEENLGPDYPGGALINRELQKRIRAWNNYHSGGPLRNWIVSRVAAPPPEPF